ncbi:hypothetical protein GCM10023170_074710 [Phytohabitans houttuyneae]|uniref:Uncharacterized protein n=1 Tax=Phytohabitans houttuyneae TaxID=1076126 RepID=A0A6V8KM77_9ACTN|nr:hypothetical protein Phou_078080 [Phytohabitans houttuyneae]
MTGTPLSARPSREVQQHEQSRQHAETSSAHAAQALHAFGDEVDDLQLLSVRSRIMTPGRAYNSRKVRQNDDVPLDAA